MLQQWPCTVLIPSRPYLPLELTESLFRRMGISVRLGGTCKSMGYEETEGFNMVMGSVREDRLSKTRKELGSCRVRSDTADPCPLAAAVRIGGVPFCAVCARDQEAYFAIGELTEEPQSLHDDERLVGLLSRIWRSGAA